MKIKERPLSEISQRATSILAQEMGVVDTLRFLSQFSIGAGNYTVERSQWLDKFSLKQIISEIKTKRKN